MLQTKEIKSLAWQNPAKPGKIRTQDAPKSHAPDANVIGHNEGSRYYTYVGTGWVATQEDQGKPQAIQAPEQARARDLGGSSE